MFTQQGGLVLFKGWAKEMLRAKEPKQGPIGELSTGKSSSLTSDTAPAAAITICKMDLQVKNRPPTHQ